MEEFKKILGARQGELLKIKDEAEKLASILKNDVSSYTSAFNQLKDSASELKNKITNLSNDYRKLDSLLISINNEINSRQELITKIEHINYSNSSIQELENEINKFEKQAGDYKPLNLENKIENSNKLVLSDEEASLVNYIREQGGKTNYKGIPGKKELVQSLKSKGVLVTQRGLIALNQEVISKLQPYITGVQQKNTKKINLESKIDTSNTNRLILSVDEASLLNYISERGGRTNYKGIPGKKDIVQSLKSKGVLLTNNCVISINNEVMNKLNPYITNLSIDDTKVSEQNNYSIIEHQQSSPEVPENNDLLNVLVNELILEDNAKIDYMQLSKITSLSIEEVRKNVSNLDKQLEVIDDKWVMFNHAGREEIEEKLVISSGYNIKNEELINIFSGKTTIEDVYSKLNPKTSTERLVIRHKLNELINEGKILAHKNFFGDNESFELANEA